jgi:hypothetical protein
MIKSEFSIESESHVQVIIEIDFHIGLSLPLSIAIEVLTHTLVSKQSLNQLNFEKITRNEFFCSINISPLDTHGRQYIA